MGCSVGRCEVLAYLSTLGPGHASTVVSSTARPDVKQIGRDHRHKKYSFYVTVDGAVLEYDLNKRCVTDWFPLRLKGRKTKMTHDSVESWPEVDHLRYAQQINNDSSHPCPLPCNSETCTWFVWQV